MRFSKNIKEKELSDDELIRQFRSTGNLNALSDVYQRYIELIYGVCLKYLEDTDDASDAVMSIFEQLITGLKKHDVIYFKAWLYQLAKNHCLMILRSRKKFFKTEMDVSLMQNEVAVHLNGELEKEENIKHLNFCLNQLIPDQRNAVELFYIQGKSYNEIVSATGIEWNMVRSFIQNGRRNLKICMDKQIKINA